MTEIGTKCAWVIRESMAVETHAHNTFVVASMCLGWQAALTIAYQNYHTNSI